MNFPKLFSPVEIGPYQLKHRLVLAPLTRMRAAKPSLAPRLLNAEYYAQRATPGGLLIAEASPVAATAFGSPGVPGIYTEAQIAGWRKVVDAVHAKGGIIFAIQSQLGITVKLVGLGETADDLVPFDADEFVDALFA